VILCVYNWGKINFTDTDVLKTKRCGKCGKITQMVRRSKEVGNQTRVGLPVFGQLVDATHEVRSSVILQQSCCRSGALITKSYTNLARCNWQCGVSVTPSATPRFSDVTRNLFNAHAAGHCVIVVETWSDRATCSQPDCVCKTLSMPANMEVADIISYTWLQSMSSHRRRLAFAYWNSTGVQPPIVEIIDEYKCNGLSDSST